MSKHRESGPMSRLSEDDAYWQALTHRVVVDAAGRLSAYRSVRTRRFRGLARFSMPLTVGATAAVIAALLWLPEVPGERARGRSPTTLYGLALNDSLAALFVTSPDAPTIATVLATPTLERAP